MYSAYNSGHGMGRVPWDARASILGQGLRITFAPSFYTPDQIIYAVDVQAPSNSVVNDDEVQNRNSDAPRHPPAGVNIVQVNEASAGGTGSRRTKKAKVATTGAVAFFGSASADATAQPAPVAAASAPDAEAGSA